MGDEDEDDVQVKILKDIQATTKSTKEELKTIRRDNAEFIKFMKESQIKQLEVDSKIENLELKIASLTSELKKLQDSSRSNNVLIHNLADNGETGIDLQNYAVSTIQKVIPDFDAHGIEEMFRLGKIPNNRPLFIKFKFLSDKKKLFQHVKTLRNNQLYLVNDLSETDREKNKQMKSLIINLKKFSIEAFIKKGKICVGQESFEPEQIREKYRAQLEQLTAERDHVEKEGTRLPPPPGEERFPRKGKRLQRDGALSIATTDFPANTAGTQERGGTPSRSFQTLSQNTPKSSKRKSNESNPNEKITKHFRLTSQQSTECGNTAENSTEET